MRVEFEKFAEKGGIFMESLSDALGIGNDYEKTLRILKSVFSALRSHLPFHESMAVLDVLPMAIRGIYVDGWVLRNGGISKINTVDDFALAVLHEDARKGPPDFNGLDEVIQASGAVIETIADFAPAGKKKADRLDNLPRGLRNLYNTFDRISRRNNFALGDYHHAIRASTLTPDPRIL